MVRVSAWPALLACALPTACAAPRVWAPVPAGVPATWEGWRLFTSRDVWFAVRGSEPAEELVALAGELGAAIADGNALALRPALWLVSDARDPLPVADAEQFLRLSGEWTRQTLGRRSGGEPRTALGSGRGKRFDPPAATMARLLTTPVPAAAPEVVLPAAWRAATCCTVIVPTDARLAASAAELVDLALEAAEVPWWQAAAASVVGRSPGTILQQSFADMRRSMLAECWLAGLGASQAQVTAVLTALGVRVHGGSEGLSDEQRAEQQAAFERGTVKAPEGPWLVGARPPELLRETFLAESCDVLVDLGPHCDEDLARDVRRAGKVHVALPCAKLPPDEAICRSLDDVAKGHPGKRIFVTALVPELAATAVALHGYHCRGHSLDRALQINRQLGGSVYDVLVREGARARQEPVPPARERR